MPTAVPVLPADAAQPTGLSHTLLTMSLTAIAVLRPLYEAAGEGIRDFAWVYLNPAGQQLLGQPECPTASLFTLLPTAQADSLFAGCCRAFETGEPLRIQATYQTAGLDGPFGLVVQRADDLLVVNFTGPHDQPRSAGEEALRARRDEPYQAMASLPGERQSFNQEATGQERARAGETLPAPAQAAPQRQVQEREELYQVFEQAPVVVGLLRGPAHFFHYCNSAFQALFPGRALTGRLYAEALPEIVAAGLLPVLDQVYATGQPYAGTALPVVTTPPDGSAPHQRYYDFHYQPYREAGSIVGVSVFAYDVTEQVLARQERETQRRQLYTMFAQAPAGIALLAGPELVFEFLNPAYQRLLPGRELLGQSILAALPELRGTEVETLLRQAYTTGETQQAHEWCVPVAHPDNAGEREDRYFTFVCQAQRDEQGRVTGILNSVFEVTDQVRARQQVEQLNRELEARVQERTHQVEVTRAEAERQRGELERVFEQAPVAIAVYRGPAYTIELANPTVARLWGRTREQLLGKGLFEALPEVAGMGYEELLDGVMATGVPYAAYAMEAQHERHGQLETVYWDFVYVPTHAADGRINGAMVVANEVTAQVRARRQVEQVNQELEARVADRTHQLAQQQQQLQAMFEQAPVALFVLRGTEYVFEVVNPSMGQMLGMVPDQVLGRRYFDLLPALEEQGYRQLLDGVWHSGQEYVAQEQAARLPHHGQGETGYYNFVYVPLREANGRVSGIMCVAVDVSTQVLARQQVQHLNQELATTNGALTAANEELHESNRQLTRTNIDLDTFVYTASHDLKAPITNIESIVLALRATLPADVQQDELTTHLLNLLDETTARFQVTIGQLTDLSKLQLAHAGPAEPVYLAAVVKSVRLDLAPAILAAEVHLTVEVESNLVVSFSPANLRSAIYNLLSNAVKYRALDRPAQVWVRAARRGDRVTVQVQDNGLGLTEHQQQRLFGLFQRLHTHVEGTGVGLYITKRLVENGGGTIAVESHVDVGTTFTLTFPA